MGEKIHIRLTFDKDFDADLLIRILQRANGGSPRKALYALLYEWRAVELYRLGQKPHSIKLPQRKTPVKKHGINHGYVYLIQSDLPETPCKIGRTKTIKKRLDLFGVKMPFGFELLHTFPCDDYITAELYLQEEYANRQVNGEWFNLSPKDIKSIKSIKNFKDGEFVYQKRDYNKDEL